MADTLENANRSKSLAPKSKGAPAGNRNNARGTALRQALDKVLHELVEERDANGRIVAKRRLYRIAEAVVAAAESGEPWACTTILDRYVPKETGGEKKTGVTINVIKYSSPQADLIDVTPGTEH